MTNLSLLATTSIYTEEGGHPDNYWLQVNRLQTAQLQAPGI